MEESNDASRLPRCLSHGAEEEKMSEVVSLIRRGRDAELESLRNRKSLTALHKQFSTPEGYTNANHASATLAQQLQEQRQKDLDRLRDGSSEMIKSMRESLSKGGCGIVSGLDEFYLGQRKAKDEVRQKEVGVWEMLKKGGTGAVSDLDEFYLSQRRAKDEGRQKEGGVWAMLSTGGTGAVSDRGGFYLGQRRAKNEGRQKEGGVWNMLHSHKALFVGTPALKSVPVNSTLPEVFSSAVAAAPSAASTDAPSAESTSAAYALSVLDYKNEDYRGFVFVVHPTHGLMLLHCTRKKSKGPHFQLPGGHVDDHEFEGAAKTYTDPKELLLAAAKAGAARELFEETGMDVRKRLARLRPAALRDGDCGDGELSCELKKRLYFFLEVDDSDFWTKEATNAAVIARLHLKKPLGKAGSNLMLKLSVEHSGFTFEKEPQKSAELLQKHSGGKGSKALLMAMSRGSEEKKVSNESGGASSKQQAAPAPSPSSAEEPSRSTAAVVSDRAAGASAAVCHEAADTSAGAPIQGRVVVVEKERNLDREDDFALDLLPRPKKKGLFSCFSCCS